MAFGSNSVEFRKVRKRHPEPDGGVNWIDTWQVKTKNVTTTVLGFIPLSASWSVWIDLDSEPIIYVDENGVELP